MSNVKAGAKKGSPKPKNLKKTLGRLFEYIGKYKYMLMAVIVFILISSFAMISGSYFLKPIINDYIIPGDFKGLVKMLALLGVIFAAGALSSLAYGKIMINISQNAIKDIRSDLFNKIQHLPVKFFDSNTNGDLMSLYTNDIDNISEALNNSVTNILSSGLTFIGVIVMMVVLSPVLSLVTF